MTLTEFLLARIADVEREAKSQPLDYLYIKSVSGPVEMRDLGPGYALVTDPARVLAECEAKRRIVGFAWGLIQDDEGSEPWVAEEVLARLALPYSDHPDYDEAWRA